MSSLIDQQSQVTVQQHLENSIGQIPEGFLKDAMTSGIPINRLMSGIPPRGPETAMNGSSMASMTKPRLEIVEQPKSRGFRFRYDCEGQSHGGLPGENSERNRKQKTYPTVRLLHYRGRARVMVSLISETDPPAPHAHSIVGKNAHDGRCLVEIGPETDMYAQFPNLGILHVTKKKVPDVLTQRLIQQVQLKEMTLEHMDTDQPSNLSEEELSDIKQQAQQIAKTMNLSVVRLCFQAFVMDEHGRFTIAVDPVFSQKVYDSKAPSAGTLKICRLDRTSGSVRGGDDVFLLCDKVQKNDIEVIFYEEKLDSSMNPVQPWTAKARFGPNDVHHQYAVVFQTPPFYNLAIERPVQVFISLRRPSDHEISEPKPFLYLPQEFDEERIGAKRKKKLQHFNNFFGDAGLGGSFFKGLGDVGGFGGTFGNLFSASGGGGSGQSGSYSGGSTTNSAYAHLPQLDIPSFDFEPSNSPSHSSFSGNGIEGLSNLSLSAHSFSSGQQQPQFAFGGVSNSAPSYGMQQQPVPTYRPQPEPAFQQQTNIVGYGQPPVHQHPQRYDLISRYSNSTPSTGRLSPSIIGTGGLALKPEKMDPGYGDVELDGFHPHRPSTGASAHRPDMQQGKASKLTLPDPENEESGFAELLEQQDSGIPKEPAVGSTDKQSDLEAEQQALKDRQVAAFQVCERMFNALLAWATTRDVRYLLAAQRSLTAVQNQEGDTAVHLAIIHNHQDVVLQLLDVLPQLPPTETPVVDCLNSYKQSPLHLAVLTRQHKVIQYLLKANANPLVCDRDGNTPLHLACKMGFLEGTAALVNRTNHINAEGCRIPELSVRNSSGQTPLHLAALYGKLEVVKHLVNAKGDANVQDSKSGKTALHYAIEKGDSGINITGYLLMMQSSTNVNVNVCDFAGNTPLHVAAGIGNHGLVSLLLAAGANLGIQNAEGETPVVMAEYGKHEGIIELLKGAIEQLGASPEPEDSITDAMESVSIKTEGDMSNLDFRARISLALLLDPLNKGADWRELCKLLYLDHLAPGLQVMTSPTKELLGMYEAYDGTIANLRQVLVEMNRTDAVSVIDRALAEDQREPTLARLASKGPSIKTAPVFSTRSVLPHTVLDSGLGCQSGSEDLSTHFGTQLPPSTSESHATFQSLATTHA